MISFQELKFHFQYSSNIPYFELIKTKEWFEKREEIIKRDSHKCTVCGKAPTMSHYDHKSGKNFNLWFGKDKLVYVKNEDGQLEKSYIPEVAFSDKPYSLHVHHRYYILEKLPWEYENEDLVTLCNWCHWELHEKETVPVFRSINDKLEKVNFTPCHRCNGAGWFPEYTHVASGICFRCKGSRYEQLINV